MQLTCLPLLAVAFFLGGCATITQGTEQVVAIDSTPSGASCDLKREHMVIARVSKTPQTVVVPKSIKTLNVTCAKAGIGRATATLESKINPMVAGNILIGGLFGGVVDSASGAMNKYPTTLNVVFPGYWAPEPKTKPEPRREILDEDGEPIG